MNEKNPAEEAWRITDLDGDGLAFGYGLKTLSVALRDKQAQGYRVKDIVILFGEKAERQS